MNSKINTEGLTWIQLRTKFKDEHSSWTGMRTRCTNPNAEFYHLYGGRGIAIEDGWDSPGREGFSKFLEDMGKRPPGTSLERKDPNKNYSKDNCKWETASNQAFNRSVFKSNTSGISGISWHNKNSTWQVQIGKDNSVFILGYTKDFFEACCIRKSWELSLYPNETTYLQDGFVMTHEVAGVARIYSRYGLTADQILFIAVNQKDRHPLFSEKALAKRFGVGRGLIRLIKSGKFDLLDIEKLCYLHNVDLRTLKHARVGGVDYEFIED